MKVAALFTSAPLMLSTLFSVCRGADEERPALRVMSFNIRYGTADDGPDAWPQRREFVLDVIREFDPDLLGTQEVLDFQAKYLREQLKDHQFVGVGRDDGKSKGEFSAILFRKDRFKLLDSGHLWLSETPDKPGSKSWDSSLPRMATWVKLADRRDGERMLYFYNTHFDHRGEKAREESAVLLRTEVETLGADERVILSGDLNATEVEEPYLIFREGLEAETVPLLDPFRVLHPDPGTDEATFHGFKGEKRGRRIDFILNSPHFTPRKAEIIRANRDGRYPSDHFPVTAVVSPQ